ncbi:MAG: hypothetical protein IKQ15_12595 [Kiritimatiellae bacterium]|nr:hypothetical protein [Kiritimatiellia bacterium]
MNILSSTLRKTARAAHAAFSLVAATGVRHPAAQVLGAGIVATVSAGAFAAFLAGETGAAILGELRRRQRLREPRPASPSLRGAPTPEELSSDCTAAPRTFHVRLRLGSRLADLAPTLDTHVRYTAPSSGSRRIRGRGRGMKGYLADNRIPANYSTLMLYKRLAIRLRRLLQLDERLPLEWLLPGEFPDRDLPSDLRVPCATARRRLARLLRELPNFNRLRRHVDARLGITPLLTARRAARLASRAAPPRARNTRNPRPTALQYAAGTWLSLMDTNLLDATRHAVADFLRERDLSPRLARLRDQALCHLGTH